MAATGVEPLTVSWQWRYPDETHWWDTTEESSSAWRFVTPVRELSFDGFRYRALVTDALGRTTPSASAAVHVTPLDPAFAEHPRSVAGLAGEPVTLRAALAEPSRLGPVTVRWGTLAADGTWHEIEGATGLTLDLTVTAATDGVAYVAHAQNVVGEAWSDPATVSLRVQPPVRVQVLPRVALAAHLPGWG